MVADSEFEAGIGNLSSDSAVFCIFCGVYPSVFTSRLLRTLGLYCLLRSEFGSTPAA